MRDDDVADLVRAVVRATQPGQFLFAFSADSFRRVFKDTCADLGLSSDYVPHSLRHGAATRDHIRGVPLEEILRRGRWASTKSARHYVQSGRAVLLVTEVPRRVLRAGWVLSRYIPSIFSFSFSLSQ